MKMYLKKYDRSLGGVEVNYKNRSMAGRVFPQKSLGLTGFGKATRNTLIDGLYYALTLRTPNPVSFKIYAKAMEFGVQM